jgi:hypothetical protein
MRTPRTSTRDGAKPDVHRWARHAHGMATPLEPVILAEKGGLVIAERGREIVVIDRGTGPMQILTFVLAIITLVFGLFGLVAVFTATAGDMGPQSGAVSAVILAIGILAGVAMAFSARSIRNRRLRPVTAFRPVAIFDRARRIYRDGTGEPVAPLDQVRFERRMQLTSSSAKLVAVTASGEHVLKRGNPFGGSIGNLDRILTEAVHDVRS